MTVPKLRALLSDRQDCPTLEAYISECGGSLPAAHLPDDGDASASIELLTILWKLPNPLSFRAVFGVYGVYGSRFLSSFSRDYEIPIRTLQDWECGRRVPPAYLLELLLCDILNRGSSMDLTIPKLHALLSDRQDCPTLEVYISECGGSLPAAYLPDDGDASAAIELLTLLWKLPNPLTFGAVSAAYGSRFLAAFSRDYGVSYSTLGHWRHGDRVPPAYLIDLLLCDVLNRLAEGDA